MWQTIKKIVLSEGGRCVVIDSDKSVYLVKKIGTDDDNELKPEPAADSAGLGESEEKKVEEINSDIADWHSEEQLKEVESNVQENEELKLEDLPL